MDKQTEERIKELQAIEQSMQTYGVQRQEVKGQLAEAESALAELEKSDEAYRIVGNIMVKTDKAALLEELTSKAATLKKRLETIQRQENRLKQEAERIQQEVMKDGDEHDIMG